MLPVLHSLLFCALLPPGGFAVFTADGGGTGSVRECTTDNSQAPSTQAQLANIQLLGCVPASRTPLDESLSGRGLLRTDIDYGTRVLLPNGAGSVYHYVRSDIQSTNYGFFSIDAAGSAHVLIELSALPGASDPFLNSIACSPYGSKLLVATQPSAGGDLWQLYTNGNQPLNRTDGIAPLVFGRDSFFLSDDLGAAVTSTGVLRFDPHQSDCVEIVPFDSGSVPAWLDLTLISSLNGRWVTFIAGDSQPQAQPFVMGQWGNVTSMHDQPDWIQGAGCLPESVDGPYLAVSDDGQQCAWRVAQLNGYEWSQELYTARRTAAGPIISLQITQAALFEDYIDEIGQVFYRPGGQLLFMGGDVGSNGAMLSRADLFSATYDDSGALLVSNLSLTSGDPAPPFLNYGTLEPFQVFVRPYSGRAMIYSREATAHHLLYSDFSVLGTQLVEDGVEALPWISTDGSEWVIGMDVPGNSQDTGLCEVDMSSNPPVDPLFNLPTLGGSARIVRSPIDPDQYACIVPQGTAERAWWVNTSPGGSRQFCSRDLLYGTAVGFASDGALILSVVTSNGSLFVVWSVDWQTNTSTSHKVWSLAQFGCVLPGA